MKLHLSSAGKARLRGGLAPAAVLATAALSLTVNNIVDLDGRVIQGDAGATSKTVNVSGTYTGQASVIEVCTVRESNNAIVKPWTTLVTNPSGGTFSAQAVLPMGPYQTYLKVRCAVNNAVTATTSRKFAVGVLMVMPGQSNMRFLSEAVTNYPLANLNNRRYRAAFDSWQRIGNYDATETYPPGTPSGTYGATYTATTPDRGDGVVTFTNAMATALGCAVGTIECSVVSTDMASWLPGTGANWINLENALAESGGDAAIWLHLQGESDASGSSSGAAWQAGAQAMLNRAMFLTGRNASQLIWGCGVLGTATTYATEGRFGVIRAAQLAFIAANSNAFMMGSFTEAPISDSVHYTNAYRPRQGRLMAFTTAAKYAGAPKTGPKIASASISSATITVQITGGVGPLKDGAGGSGNSLQGFRVYDNGALATISSIGISGSTVVIVLSAVPSGPVTMDHGMANAPYGSTPAAASILYDSDVIAGETLGMNLQPKALFTVS